MVRNIRNIFLRARLSDTEVQTLRGVVRYLARRKQRGNPRDVP
jgi:tRNA C32,U32 (ribose-2'-O)-methylase TrmJ